MSTNESKAAKPSDPETEVAFLRAQVISLQGRLCETLAQQVAQQQTVLIAAMQTNLALTQSVDKMNRIADALTEMIDKREEALAEARAEPSTGAGADFGAVLSALLPHLIAGAGGASQPKPSPEAPAWVSDQQVIPPQQAPDGATVTTVIKPRADGTGYDEHTRVETKRQFPGLSPESIQHPTTRVNPVPGKPAEAKNSNSKEPKQ
jgi:hypothetical protein